MKRSEVYRVLKQHFERTGQVMDSEALILTCGPTDPAQLMSGRALFDKHLDLQKGGAA